MDDLNKFIPLFLQGGWVVLLIGASGMIARTVTSKNPEEKSFGQFFSNVLVAMIASLISWFILEQFEVKSMYKSIIYGLVGLNSPEILTGMIKISTSFSNNPQAFIKNAKSGKITSGKTTTTRNKNTKR
jgi:uncharacterized membrane protein YeaQ/YmgE (transglycosylase-associated protein family)